MIKTNYKILLRLLIILAIFGGFVNSAFADDSPFGDSQDTTAPDLSHIQFLQPSGQQAQAISDTVQAVTPPENNTDANEIILNSLIQNISQDEMYAGKKIKAFDKFVFQIDKKLLKTSATLDLHEIMLSPSSQMAPKNGFQLASKVYEFNFAAEQPSVYNKTFWISIKYDSIDYFRKNLYYYDDTKNEWVGIKGIISNGASKIIANISMPKAKVAILEDIDIMTEGYASWYKYKGCNCAASPDYPKGTKLKVTNIANNKSIVVKVNDWGPDRSVHPNRVIDLDVVAFKQIAKKSQGLCQVKVEPLTVESAVK
jgi:hypothetical protein